MPKKKTCGLGRQIADDASSWSSSSSTSLGARSYSCLDKDPRRRAQRQTNPVNLSKGRGRAANLRASPMRSSLPVAVVKGGGVSKNRPTLTTTTSQRKGALRRYRRAMRFDAIL
jgi:hypothetical protein